MASGSAGVAVGAGVAEGAGVTVGTEGVAVRALQPNKKNSEKDEENETT